MVTTVGEISLKPGSKISSFSENHVALNTITLQIHEDIKWAGVNSLVSHEYLKSLCFENGI